MQEGALRELYRCPSWEVPASTRAKVHWGWYHTFLGVVLLRSCTGYCPEVLGRVQGTLLSENGWSPRTIVDFSPAFLSFRSVSRRGFAARQPRRQQRGCCPKLRRQSRRYPKRRQLRSCCPRLLRQLGRCCLRHHIATSGDVEKIVTRMTSFYCNHIYEI